jgi:hypothetical protein
MALATHSKQAWIVNSRDATFTGPSRRRIDSVPHSR